MKRYLFLLLALVLASSAVPARAGIFNWWKRHKNEPSQQETGPAQRDPAPVQRDPGPSQRVSNLIYSLKSESSEHKRAAAAEELRGYDNTTYPQIVPALIDSALSDQSASVRYEAVLSLARMRPVSQEAGWALEQVAAKDDSTRVKMQARASLIQYRISGYHGGKNDATEGPSLMKGDPAGGTVIPQEGPSFAPPLPTGAPTMTTSPRFRPAMTPPRSGMEPIRVGPSGAPPMAPTTAEPPLLDPSAPATPGSDGPALGQP